MGCICAGLNSGTVCDWRQARPRHYSWRRDTVRLILLPHYNNKPALPQWSRTGGRVDGWTDGASVLKGKAALPVKHQVCRASVLPGKQRINRLLKAIKKGIFSPSRID